MSKVMKRMGKEEKGFTLIELLAVIVIMAIIAVIAIPMIGNVINKSKANGDLATASQVYNSARLYVIGEKNGDFTTVANRTVTLANMTSTGYLNADTSLPSSKQTLTAATVVFTEKGELVSVTLAPVGQGSTNGAYTAAQVLSATPATPAAN
ncbi:prepilin-type N-terminal cleavage/methylation domain-containing protein [Paenibacillus sp. CFBP13512]|nr:prepilin-type N-terminal cleavage/methylation domain-containing protein [Paenibacillus sp. CFBP13512]